MRCALLDAFAVPAVYKLAAVSRCMPRLRQASLLPTQRQHICRPHLVGCADVRNLACSAGTKFDSGCGWPAFYDNVPDTVERHEDSSMGMTRIEITCKNCGGHLGALPCI